MKKLLSLLFVLGVSLSCKKSDVPAKLAPVLEPIEEVNLIVPENLKAPITPQGDSTYNVIGYGYDVTGKHNDASSIRDNVVDFAAFMKSGKPSYVVPSKSRTSWHDSYDAANAEVLANALSAEFKITEGKGLYGGTMTELFPTTTAFSEKYIYGYYSHYFQYKAFKIMLDDQLITTFRDYLSPSFKSDVDNLNAEILVEKYGTHVLADIVLGAKLDILYQAETADDERSKVQQNAYDAAIKTSFGLWTSRFNDIDSAKLRKVKSPALSFRVAGGDPSKIKIIETPEGRKVVISDWLNTIANQNHVFIQAGSMTPLTNLIANEKKRAEVELYIASYLEKKQVKLNRTDPN